MDDALEFVHGSGNVFRDFESPLAGLEQARAILAGEIIRILDERRLSMRAAGKLTGVAASKLSRLRQARLAGFTLTPRSLKASTPFAAVPRCGTIPMSSFLRTSRQTSAMTCRVAPV
jgi:hypothetical protein